MISKSDIQQLAERQPNESSPVLSVYLNVDQSRNENLNRHFEVKLRNLLRSTEKRLTNAKKIQEFSEDADRIAAFVGDYAPKGQTLVMFSDASDGFFWWHDLRAPLLDDARWNAAPFVLPLMEALDEFERYGIILADRARARLFTVFLGEIEEHVDVLALFNVQRVKTAGTDHIWSQNRFQRKADDHEIRYLKRVADTMNDLAHEYSFDRLVLAGVQEATSELLRQLPKRLRSRVIAELALPVVAGAQEVLEATLKVEVDAERAREERIVDGLIAAAAKGRQAVVGLDATLDELQRGRLYQLVYAEGVRPPGWQCRNCSSLFGRQLEKCEYCERDIAAVGDLIEQLARRVITEGGKVEQVRGEPAAVLSNAGGVGGYLRY